MHVLQVHCMKCSLRSSDLPCDR